MSDTFGIRLRKAREQKSLTQVELAKNLGISQSAVAQWELGRSFPAPAMASRLQKLLGSVRRQLRTRSGYWREGRLTVGHVCRWWDPQRLGTRSVS